MNSPTPYRKKLIEVDLPLDAINRESARDASITQGHPSTLHRYWARRPLATCRAVIFASMVDDPSACPEEFPTESEQEAERERLHKLIKQLVAWKNSNNEVLLAEARHEIARSVARSHREIAPTNADEILHYLSEKVPPVYDPFCGGGSIPLEAQRLGLRAVASDLNPVAVLINKAMVDLPHPFRDKPPVNPDADPMGIFVGSGKNRAQVPWRGTAGLAADIRYYGRWMREEAYKRIGHLYPKAKLPDGTEATVIAWLWARTVPCANPACRIPMPLIKTFQLSTRIGNEHWTRPIVNQETKALSFMVQNHNTGIPENGTVNRNGAVCVACRQPVKLERIRQQAEIGKMEEILTAIVAESSLKKLFLSPTEEHIQMALSAEPTRRPRGKLSRQAANLAVLGYGITDWHQLFTERQLTALTTFGDLLTEVRHRVLQAGAESKYADAVCTYLAFAIDRTADGHSSFTFWYNSSDRVVGLFARQFIPMMWNFPEANPFSDSRQNWMSQIELVAKAVANLPVSANASTVYQADATTTRHACDGFVIVTDPPYYDNIGYADLSDFFYIWLRPLLRDIYPELFWSMSTPKDEEMVVNKSRFENSHIRFEKLMEKVLRRLRQHCPQEFPASIFYAYKQLEEEQDGRTSTGWETILTAIVNVGFQIVATWPMRTEQSRALKTHKNALASSIVLVCRPRPDLAQNISLGGFLTALRNEMPAALDRLTHEAHIAPVDLAQAAIGPGMEIYSRYKSVKTTRDGNLVDVSVREALVEINNEIDRYHAEQEGAFDLYTRFCLTWFKQHGFAEGEYGDAETLAKANDIGIASMQGRVLIAERGKVRLLSPDAYDDNHPNSGLSLLQMTTWEACHLMAYHLNPKNEAGRDVPGAVEVGLAMKNNAISDSVMSVEQLARLLYSHYDRIGDSDNAVLFNSLVTSWDSIEGGMEQDEQLSLPTE